HTADELLGDSGKAMPAALDKGNHYIVKALIEKEDFDGRKHLSVLTEKQIRGIDDAANFLHAKQTASPKSQIPPIRYV
ncbi:MAG: hypothetical protein ABL857_01870, partial [Rickettsiales bacterium]